MATLATLFKRAEPAGGPAPARDSDFYRLRPIPNEDVYFYSKHIDNSRVLRETNPRERGKRLKAIGVCSLVALALMAAVTPHVGVVLAGYRIESLKKERQNLMNERASLALDVARLLSPARLEELARTQQFVDPAPGQVVYLNPKPDGALASLHDVAAK